MILKVDQENLKKVGFSSPDELSHIIDLIDAYMEIPYTIYELRRDDINDPHGRVDIEIRFVDEKNCPIQQKLLILDDEVVDGMAFHKRYKEWYS